MKFNSKNFLLIIGCLITFFACKKVENKFYPNGTPVTLSTSVTSVAAKPSDSANTVLTLNWTNPKYATDSTNQKFVIQLDSTGNFASPVSFQENGALSYSFTGNQLNSVLANFGLTAGKPFNVFIRVVSSYANNNEQYKSNTVTVSMTPYLIPITLTPSPSGPLVLQITNATSNAISFNWNASPYGSNTINYALQLDTAGGNFASPQVIKYGDALTSQITVNDLNTAAIAAGVMGGSTKNMEFRIVSYLGTDYSKILSYSAPVNITVTTYVAAPANLYIVGDATPGGWANPVPVPSQQFTKIDAVSFGIILNLKAGGSYLLLPVNSSWDHKYGGTSATGGTLLADNSVPGSNTPAPATTGLYKIVVNFQTNTYTVTPYTGMPLPTSIGINKGLWIIGDATAGGWNNDSKNAPDGIGNQQFTQISNAEYQITIPLTGGKGYLLIPEDQGMWNNKYGGSTDGTASGGGTLLFDGDVPGSNTPAPSTSGTYLIDVNFITGKYTVTPH
jgi:hypothetical protein